jgi:hypothetical protein
MAGHHGVMQQILARRNPRHAAVILNLIAVLALLPWLGACSTIVFYNEPGAPNLHFRATSSGRFLSFTAIHLDIHRVTADCRSEYIGSHHVWAPLGQTTDPVHLPEERLSLLEFKFKTHGGGESVTSYKTLLRPRAGRTYEAAVNYDAGLYEVEIRETGPDGGPGHKIEHRSLSECHRV